ncbi:MAG: leucine dehydrogenase [Bacteroidia bacterium]|nr:leucine dehydrogenase [Bacteroidia bacterium]
MNHEVVVYCYDKETGLKAIIAVHNTLLGPALGGLRMWAYKNEADALEDVLRLSRGMTYKAAISGLDLGGGKAVIIGDSKKDKSPALFRKFGQYVNYLAGKYITAEDVGTSTEDMANIAKETRFVTGLPQDMGGSGDPSPVTAYGVFMGLKASAKHVWGSDDLHSKKVLVQGVGHVGRNLVSYLSKEGAVVSISDINQQTLKQVSEEFNISVVSPEKVFDAEVDIYAPCALGAILNNDTIPRLRCSIVSGAANNQLADEVIHGQMLLERGIVYAPDFLINAGGLINVYSELKKFDRATALKHTEKIYDQTLNILKKASVEKITSHQAAMMLAEQRLEAAARH